MSGGAATESTLVDALLSALGHEDEEGAIHLYEENGRAVGERLLVALQKSPPSIRDAGARMFAQARDFQRAARLLESAKYWPDAAKMYEEAHDFRAASRAWKRAGDLKAAARTLDAAGDSEEAAALWEQAGEREPRAAAQARASKWLQSAASYREAGNTRAETDILKQVPLEDPDRVPAVKRLAEILLARRRTAEAAQLVADVVRDNELGRTDIELHDLLAGLFDQLGQAQHAERVRLRAERLRSRAAATSAPGADSIPPAPAGAAAPPDGYKLLKKIPFFARLSLDDMRDLYRLCNEEVFAPGTNLVDVGSDPPGLYVILEGDAEIYALGPSGARHLNSVGPGSHLGEISLLTNSLTSARITASTEVRALRIGREQFELFLGAHPGAALRIYRLFSEGLAERVKALSLAE